MSIKDKIDSEIEALNKELEKPSYGFLLYSSFIRTIRDNYISLKSIIQDKERENNEDV